MKLYAVRHGRTEWNVQKIMQGHTDIALNDEGISQAYELKKVLGSYSFDWVFVSPLKRAVKTAEIITEDRHIPLIPADAIRERSYGEFEGQSRKTFNYFDFWNYELNLQYKKAENIRDFFRRVWSFLDTLKARFPNEKVLLVTHSGVIRAIECYADPTKANSQLGYWIPDNCSVNEYEF